MKKLVTLAVVAIFAVSAVNAKNGVMDSQKNQAPVYAVKGSIIDPNSNEEVSGAMITIEGKKFYSDLSGNFAISGLTKGKHTMTVNFVSYQTKSMEIDLSNNLDLKIELKQQ